MVRNCKYDEKRDVQAVDQVGYIDVGEAIRNGYVPASIDTTEDSYDNIETPDGLMRNADDVFALYRQADYVKSVGAAPQEEATDE